MQLLTKMLKSEWLKHQEFLSLGIKFLKFLTTRNAIKKKGIVDKIILVFLAKIPIKDINPSNKPKHPIPQKVIRLLGTF